MGGRAGGFRGCDSSVALACDFSTVGLRLERGHYRSAHAFAQDVRLTLLNCLAFETEGTPVVKLAQRCVYPYPPSSTCFVRDRRLLGCVSLTAAWFCVRLRAKFERLFSMWITAPSRPPIEAADDSCCMVCGEAVEGPGVLLGAADLAKIACNTPYPASSHVLFPAWPASKPNR